MSIPRASTSAPLVPDIFLPTSPRNSLNFCRSVHWDHWYLFCPDSPLAACSLGGVVKHAGHNFGREPRSAVSQECHLWKRGTLTATCCASDRSLAQNVIADRGPAGHEVLLCHNPKVLVRRGGAAPFADRISLPEESRQ